MEELIKQVSYIKGLAEGLDLKDATPEGKLILKMLDVLDSLADYAADMEDRMSLTEERVSECEDYLDIIADDFYDEDGEPIDMSDDDYDIFGDDDEDDDDLFDFGDDDEDDSDFFEIECPGCGEDVLVDFDSIDDDNGIICPNCHKEIVLEFDADADADDDEDEE